MSTSAKPSGKFSPTLADKLAAMNQAKREAAAKATAKLAQARQARAATDASSPAVKPSEG